MSVRYQVVSGSSVCASGETLTVPEAHHLAVVSILRDPAKQRNGDSPKTYDVLLNGEVWGRGITKEDAAGLEPELARQVSEESAIRYVPTTTEELKAMCRDAPHLRFEDSRHEWESYYDNYAR